MRTDRLGPYLGFGWATALDRGVGVSFDLGVFHHGRPSVEMRAETTLPLDRVPGAREALEELISQEEREIEDEIAGHRLFPVVSLGLTYRF